MVNNFTIISNPFYKFRTRGKGPMAYIAPSSQLCDQMGHFMSMVSI